ncbi:uncharacterized protein LOC113551915 [Rhopalosiphum maidis]|uniref:uncharacterized protein LOC113551915 n=1 Tax=Rhopalosiphum maidis TaxID=43146 RepID=UPI000EFF9684|nr:uncharacterized protein LOC113551915 [Rhopalosiphum maidis]
MENIHFYLVSIFLSCYVKLSIATIAVGMTNSTNTLRSPAVAANQKLFSDKPNALNVSSTSGLTNTNYHPLQTSGSSTTKISAKNKPDEYRVDLNNLTDTPYDNPGESNTLSFQLYNATAGVLNFLLENWLNHKEELDKMAEYFQISDDIVLTVNGSMAQLFEFQRNNNEIKIENLSNLFYYLLDIEHMSKRDDVNVIEKTLKDLKSKIQFQDLLNSIGGGLNNGIDSLINSLKLLVNDFEKNTQNLSYIMVNVVLMKGMMLIKKSSENNFNKMINALSNDYLSEVRANQFEIERSPIDQNHVKLIRNVMPIIFGILYTHIELLTELNNYTIDGDQEKRINSLNKFFSEIMNIFINRYFIFGNKNKKTELQSIQQLLKMLDPPKNMDDGKTPESKSNIITSTFLDTTENAIAEVLNLVGKNDVNDWKQNNVFKIDYQKDKNKDYYMEQLNINAELLYTLLESFENRFLTSVEFIRNNNI